METTTPDASTVTREQMFEAEMTHQELSRIQERLSQLDKQLGEILSMREALAGFEQVKSGEELLVPLAAGVFARATATDDKVLHVNVGNGVVVPKSVAQVHTMLDTQTSEIRAFEAQLHAQFDKGLARLQELEKALSDARGANAVQK